MCRCDEPVPPMTFMIVVALGAPPPMSNIIAAIVRVGLAGAVMSAFCADQSVGLSTPLGPWAGFSSSASQPPSAESASAVATGTISLESENVRGLTRPDIWCSWGSGFGLVNARPAPDLWTDRVPGCVGHHLGDQPRQRR